MPSLQNELNGRSNPTNSVAQKYENFKVVVAVTVKQIVLLMETRASKLLSLFHTSWLRLIAISKMFQVLLQVCQFLRLIVISKMFQVLLQYFEDIDLPVSMLRSHTATRKRFSIA